MSGALLNSYGLIPFRPEPAGELLRVLALRRAPGWRSGYVDGHAEPALFLILLDAHLRCTGDARPARAFEPQARAALRWLSWYGDPDGDGYLDDPTGVAPCELQGYGYGALRRAARLAREVWRDPELAGTLAREARALRRRFDADFWLPERGWYTRGLAIRRPDGAAVCGWRKRPLPELARRVGLLLWSGIVAPERLDTIVAKLRRGREAGVRPPAGTTRTC
jgi:glycogen debranching enzyme